MGEKIRQFSEPVCTAFQETLLEGQVCYSINFEKLKGITIRKGRESGLKLILDYNQDRSTSNTAEPKSEKSDMFSSQGDVHVSKDVPDKAKIYINTLKPFITYGGGTVQWLELNATIYPNYCNCLQ